MAESTPPSPDTEAQPVPSPLNENSVDASKRIAEEINDFHRNLDSLAVTSPSIMKSLTSVTKAAGEDIETYEKQHAKNIEVAEDSRIVTMTPETITPYRRLLRRYGTLSTAAVLLPETLLVALVSQYDAFLGGLVRALMNGKPDVTKNSNINLTFAQLVAFDSIEAARDAIISAEVEQLLRKGHAEQFSWLEKKFTIELKKDVDEWPDFIELTERRNLFVHARGIVSRQYMDVCRKNRVRMEAGTDVGSSLYVNQAYFLKAQRCILIVGVMLGHTLWRKVLPECRERADKHMSEICYELLVERRYDVAARLLDFVCGLKTFASEEYRRTMVVNRAQAYKWLENDEKCAEIMGAEDWSASDESFRLADAVLRDDVEQSTRIMRRLGATDERVAKQNYREWPLFRSIRTKEMFRETYQEIFGEPLEQVEVKVDRKAQD